MLLLTTFLYYCGCIGGVVYDRQVQNKHFTEYKRLVLPFCITCVICVIRLCKEVDIIITIWRTYAKH